MSKELTKKQETGISTNVMDFGDFGNENLISQDLKIPRILLAQAMSEYVSNRLGFAGDIYESLESKKLGDQKSPVKIIPFFNTNSWYVTKKGSGGKFEFCRIDERGGLDIKRDYHFAHEDGVPGTQTRMMNLFCLLKNGSSIVPYMVSFRNFSFKEAAQSYLDHTNILKTEKRSPAHFVWDLSCDPNFEHNDSKFGIFKLDIAKDTNGKRIENSYEEVKAAYEAYKSMKAAFDSGAKVDFKEEKVEDIDTPF
jgi:hypothetical protein